MSLWNIVSTGDITLCVFKTLFRLKCYDITLLFGLAIDFAMKIAVDKEKKD